MNRRNKMGLDQYINATKNGKTKEIAYFRKQPALQGWMCNLWVEKGKPIPTDKLPEDEENYDDFNCVPVDLTLEDIKRLEADVKSFNLPYDTRGFFFSVEEPSKENNKEYLKVTRKIKGYLTRGYKVEYSSWW